MSFGVLSSIMRGSRDKFNESRLKETGNEAILITNIGEKLQNPRVFSAGMCDLMLARAMEVA